MVLQREGGFLEQVDQRRINLADKVQDGPVLYIPDNQEKIPAEYPLPGQDIASFEHTTSTNTSQKIDLNQSSTSELEQISGIGAKRAAEIIAYRNKQQSFRELKELKEIAGIAEKTFLKLSEKLKIKMT